MLYKGGFIVKNFEIERVIEKLKERRKIFYSEDEFDNERYYLKNDGAYPKVRYMYLINKIVQIWRCVDVEKYKRYRKTL